MPYSFAVIRYVHDHAAGEFLNVGVAVCAPAHRYIGVRVEPRTERLAGAFRGFDGAAYRRVVSRLVESIADTRREWESVPSAPSVPSDAASVLRSVWPDSGLALSIGPSLAGVSAEPPDRVLDELFVRMVVSQAPGLLDAAERPTRPFVVQARDLGFKPGFDIDTLGRHSDWKQ